MYLPVPAQRPRQYQGRWSAACVHVVGGAAPEEVAEAEALAGSRVEELGVALAAAEACQGAAAVLHGEPVPGLPEARAQRRQPRRPGLVDHRDGARRVPVVEEDAADGSGDGEVVPRVGVVGDHGVPVLADDLEPRRR